MVKVDERRPTEEHLKDTKCNPTHDLIRGDERLHDDQDVDQLPPQATKAGGRLRDHRNLDGPPP